MNRSKRIEILNHLKVVIPETYSIGQDVDLPVPGSLYTLPNGRLIMANSRNVISSGPEMLAGNIPATAHKVPRYVDCTNHL
jgi:hypothetical protein